MLTTAVSIGLTLRLTIDREGMKNQEVTLEAKLQSEFSKDFSHLYNTYARERKEEREPLSKEYSSGIVYLRFPSFMTAPHDAGAFINRAKSARAVILDLRENGGGRIDSLEEIAGHLFDQPH